ESSGRRRPPYPCRREGRQRTFRRQNDGIESQLLESLLADLGCAVVGPEASVKQALAMTDAEAQPVQKKPTIQVSSRFIRQIRANGSQSKRAAWQKTKTLTRLQHFHLSLTPVVY